jgi:hypothetical protein
MYAPHEAWEDTLVFPALRAVTPTRTLGQLGERFAQLAARQFGADPLATVLRQVVAIEEQLGIADLAAFTPVAD